MNKSELCESLARNYKAFTYYIGNLNPDEYGFATDQKWTAGQQLEHLILCVKPLVQVFGMEKQAIAQTFGKPAAAGRDYAILLRDYEQKLREGGKAPGRFVPEPVSLEQRAVLCETLNTLIAELNKRISLFSEEELNTLAIPHPLLGNISLREMLYNAIAHVQHHQEATKRTISFKTA
ncbi:MAG TPA: DinB family protein [Bacteroidia bacterium]|jgi:hypothetical protein|nr:DinB family protein [Bacteroidia bacterium]